MSETMFVDLVRFGHLVGLALGLGLAVYADSRFLRSLTEPFDPLRLAELRRTHVFVSVALAILWASGILLLAIRTGLDPDRITPKLLAKLAVVTAMTVNARLIATVALPLLHRAGGTSFCRLRPGQRLRLAAIGAVSAASWLSALLLGTVAAFKPMGAPALAAIFGGIYGLAFLGAVAVALLAPVVLRRRRQARLRPLGGLAA
jgi:hypothetical protein